VTETEQSHVTAQVVQSRGRAARWAYVIHRPGYWPWVSKHAYGTPEAALRAGEKDLEMLLGYLASAEVEE
jgi:hypothetical protein